jgi:hypothetical protein
MLLSIQQKCFKKEVSKGIEDLKPFYKDDQ